MGKILFLKIGFSILIFLIDSERNEKDYGYCGI